MVEGGDTLSLAGSVAGAAKAIAWLRDNRVAFQEWDGSSDELVRHSIRDKLDRERFFDMDSDAARRFVLIVDDAPEAIRRR